MPSLPYNNLLTARRTMHTSLALFGVCLGSLSLAGCGSGNDLKNTTNVATLAEYTTDVPLTESDTTVYTDTYSQTYSPDPYNQSVTNQTQTITNKGNAASASNLIPDGGDSLGNPFSTTLSLPKSGNITVTKQALLDNEGNVEGYEYYKLTDSGETYYGDDTLSRGEVSQTTRYDPGIDYPYTLEPGQVSTQTYTDYETTYTTTGNVSGSYNFSITSSTTFASVLPSYTVTGGTFTNVAQVQYFSSATLPAGTIGNVNVEAITDTATFYLSKYVGVVRNQDVITTANELITPTVAGESPYTTTQTDSHDQVLTSANVGGVAYPPGRAASGRSASAGTATIRIGHLLHQRRMQSAAGRSQSVGKKN